MKFKIGDIVTVRSDWNLYEINMIYENGEGNYIELVQVGKSTDDVSNLSLHSHKALELIERKGITLIANDANKDMFDFDDRPFRESLEKKRTINPYVLLRVWLLKRRYNK